LSAARDAFPGIPLVESPLFHSFIDDLGLSASERQVAIDLHERGYAVIDFPEEQLEERIDRIKSYLMPLFDVDMADPEADKNSRGMKRVQDAWVHNEDVRAIAANRGVLDLLQKLYGRRAFPFQTLNFPVGTQQHLHSDSIHFSCIPERFMCGVWLAMEDIRPDAGPLTYLPGSHRWPILSNAMLGRLGSSNSRDYAQVPFEDAWDKLVSASGTEQETFLARKGQALIWAANLLHGGSPQLDPKLTRWSQVTHYYFEDCIYYTPAFSDEALGQLDLRVIVDVETDELRPSTYLGEPIGGEPAVSRQSFVGKMKQRIFKNSSIPADFDADAYYRLNPDVAAAKLDAATHYLGHGKQEGRRYRFRQ
jgi:hypothetical protein